MTEDPDRNQPPTASGPSLTLLRLQLERGHGTWTDDTEGRVDAADFQAAVDGQRFETANSWGGRASAGIGEDFARGTAAALAVFALGLSRYESEESHLRLAGRDVSWKSRSWAWSLTGGMELQILWRVVFLGADVGLGGVALFPNELDPPALEMDNKYKTGVLGRLRAGLLAPLPGGWGLGAEVSTEGFILPRHPLSPGMTPRGRRTAWSILLEWRPGGAKKGGSN